MLTPKHYCYRQRPCLPPSRRSSFLVFLSSPFLARLALCCATVENEAARCMSSRCRLPAHHPRAHHRSVRPGVLHSVPLETDARAPHMHTHTAIDPDAWPVHTLARDSSLYDRPLLARALPGAPTPTAARSGDGTTSGSPRRISRRSCWLARCF